MYEPLPLIKNEKVINYWKELEDSIAKKEKENGRLELNEILFKSFITNIGKNEEIYELKQCRKLND